MNSVIGGGNIAPSAPVQRLAGPKLGATAAAIYMAVVILVALSAGAAVVRFLSDRSAPVTVINSLRWALRLICLVYMASLPLFLAATRTVVGDLEEAANA